MGKGKIITFFATDEEAKEIETKAKKDRRTKSNWIKCKLFDDKSIKGWGEK